MEGSAAGGVGVRSSRHAPPRLTFPGEVPHSGGGEVEAESDLLPFAIDREPSVTSPCRPSFLHEEFGMDALLETDPTMSGGCPFPQRNRRVSSSNLVFYSEHLGGKFCQVILQFLGGVGEMKEEGGVL